MSVAEIFGLTGIFINVSMFVPCALQWRDVPNVPRKVRQKIQEVRVLVGTSKLTPLELKPRTRHYVWDNCPLKMANGRWNTGNVKLG
jgi:hypothetical protein